MRLHCFEHEEFEGMGSIRDWCKERAVSVEKTCFYRGESLPQIDSFDCLLVMGGSMGTYDEDKYSWLKAEKEFLKRIVKSGKPILGICLGSQLLAEAIGGKVFPGPKKEIGWFDVFETPARNAHEVFSALPSRFSALHWHGDTFELPPGVTAAYSSDCYRNQAFAASSRIIGLQFHLELTKADLTSLAGCGMPAATSDGSVQELKSILVEDEKFTTCRKLLYAFLDAVFL